MVGKNSWTSTKHDFCCCPSVFGEGEGGKQWFIANSFENRCEQKITEGSNLILKRSFACSGSGMAVAPRSTSIGRRHVRLLLCAKLWAVPRYLSCNPPSAPLHQLHVFSQTGDKLPLFPFFFPPNTGCACG